MLDVKDKGVVIPRVYLKVGMCENITDHWGSVDLDELYIERAGEGCEGENCGLHLFSKIALRRG